MAEERTTSEGSQPRRFLNNPAKFGSDPAAPWRRLVPEESVTEQIAAYWQHLAVCTLRDMFPTQLVEELSARLGKDNLVYLRRQVAGEYRVSIEELVGWAITFEDISLLPTLERVEDLYPPEA